MHTIVFKYNYYCATGFDFNPTINKYGHSTKKPFQWLLADETSLWDSHQTSEDQNVSEEQKVVSEKEMMQEMVEMVYDMACEEEDA